MSAPPLIHGEGTPDGAWRRWLQAAAVVEWGVHEWLPTDARLVVVAPHPDDEVLACGALLSLHAARGGQAAIVAVTDGEGSHPASTGWSPTALRDARSAERLEGLACLGVGESTLLRCGYVDGDVAGRIDALTDELGSLLAPSDVVVTTWRHDGHPDHDAVGHAAACACAGVGCRLYEAPVWMWHWASPGEAGVPWHRLRGLRVDEPAWRRKQAAVAAHRTQLVARDGVLGPVLGASILARAARRTEYYFV